MANGNRSANHHWWPVALQSYWADKQGNVSWIDPERKIGKKRFQNRKIGTKRHGHTMLRGKGVWETNFESEFDIDDRIHSVISGLNNLKPLGQSPTETLRLLKLLFKKDQVFRDISRFYHLEEKLHRDALLLIHALIIRSPGWRSKYERFPMRFDLPPSEDVGKANMNQNYRIAKDLCSRTHLSLHSFVLLHSPRKKFICGDGYMDWLTPELIAMRIRGRALIPLTPHLCVYFCTLGSKRQSSPNCAALTAPAWVVDWVNDMTQIYSGRRLFFLGKPPSLTEHFIQGEFLEHSDHRDALIEMLDELAGSRPRDSLISTGLL